MAAAVQLSWGLSMKLATLLHSTIVRAVLIFFGIFMLAFLYLRIFAGKLDQRVFSPDGRTVAECRTFDFAAATDADQTAVQISSRFNPFRHTVFSGLNYGATVSASWLNPRTLLIRCTNCKDLDIRGQEHRWKDITIRYEIE